MSSPAQILVRAMRVVPVAVLLSIAPSIATSQETATPEATPVAAISIPINGADMAPVGTATVTESAGGAVTIQIEVTGLEPGEHGLAIHEHGICAWDAANGFASAGGHFDPTEGAHGSPDNPEAHAGDLGNLTVDADGSGRLTIESSKVTLSPGPVSLADTDGSTIVIHALPDDMLTDPDGGSGRGVACGVLAPPRPENGIGTPTAATPAT